MKIDAEPSDFSVGQRVWSKADPERSGVVTGGPSFRANASETVPFSYRCCWWVRWDRDKKSEMVPQSVLCSPTSRLLIDRVEKRKKRRGKGEG